MSALGVPPAGSGLLYGASHLPAVPNVAYQTRINRALASVGRPQVDFDHAGNVLLPPMDDATRVAVLTVIELEEFLMVRETQRE